jgi:uncharacterized protein YdaU (DUF1376 family)
MSSLPYIQLYIADYLADTQHLTTEEHGAYLLLIFNYWQRGKSFKARDEHVLNKCLASVAHMSEQNFNLIKNVLSEFFEVRENEWIHHRIEQDLERVNEMSEKRRNAGKASAEARKIKGKTAKKKAKSTHDQQVLNKCLTSVEQVLIYKDKDKDKEYISKESNTLASITKEKQKNGTRLSADFDLPEDWILEAKKIRNDLLDDRIKMESEKFKDYWTAKSGKDAVKLDWQATWRNWIRGVKTGYSANSKTLSSNIGSVTKPADYDWGVNDDGSF